MSCSICDGAGHDEELHGKEGQEILQLREENRELRAILKKVCKPCAQQVKTLLKQKGIQT